MPEQQSFDVFIVGGGPVGSCLALALNGLGLSVGLAEARAIAVDGDAPDQPGYDDKALALSRASVQVLESLSLWPDLAGQATPIRAVHVSQRGRLGRTLLRASEAGLDSLGHVLPARTLGNVLNRRLTAAADLSLLQQTRLIAVEQAADSVTLELEAPAGARRVEARLVVGADGARSVLREHLGIGVRDWDYGQVAVSANLTPQLDHRGRAYERFTPEGPLALLPMNGRRMGLVWAGRPDFAESLMALSDATFLQRLQEAFGMRLGRLERLGRRHSHPLAGVHADTLRAGRAVLVGNAAQTLHPVAAQGFNLGLRDAVTLAEVIGQAARRGDDPGGDHALARYQAWRREDRERTAGFTDMLARWFDIDLAPLAHVRGLGLMALDLAPPLKRAFMRRAMGLGGRVPRLALGVPLDCRERPAHGVTES